MAARNTCLKSPFFVVCFKIKIINSPPSATPTYASLLLYNTLRYISAPIASVTLIAVEVFVVITLTCQPPSWVLHCLLQQFLVFPNGTKTQIQ